MLQPSDSSSTSHVQLRALPDVIASVRERAARYGKATFSTLSVLRTDLSSQGRDSEASTDRVDDGSHRDENIERIHLLRSQVENSLRRVDASSRDATTKHCDASDVLKPSIPLGNASTLSHSWMREKLFDESDQSVNASDLSTRPSSVSTQGSKRSSSRPSTLIQEDDTPYTKILRETFGPPSSSSLPKAISQSNSLNTLPSSSVRKQAPLSPHDFPDLNDEQLHNFIECEERRRALRALRKLEMERVCFVGSVLNFGNVCMIFVSFFPPLLYCCW